jgi:hypothetical protein
VLTEGDTANALPVNAPGVQLYPVPPVAVRVTVLPTQSEDELADTLTVGSGLTSSEIVFELLHARLLVPVTV